MVSKGGTLELESRRPATSAGAPAEVKYLVS